MGPFFSTREERSPDPSGKPVGRRNRGGHCSHRAKFLNGFRGVGAKNTDGGVKTADEPGMDTPLPSLNTRIPRPAIRVLAAGVFLIAFFTLTSLIDPSQSTATESMGTERGEVYGPVLGGGGEDPVERMLGQLPTDANVLGTLEGRHAVVIITAGELEARYSVFTPQGEARVIEATLNELYDRVPDLDIEGMLSSGYGDVDQSVPIDLDDGWMY